MKSVNAPKQATPNNAIACPQSILSIRVTDSGDFLGAECGKRPQGVTAESAADRGQRGEAAGVAAEAITHYRGPANSGVVVLQQSTKFDSRMSYCQNVPAL
jgi:hypothetical protein